MFRFTIRDVLWLTAVLLFVVTLLVFGQFHAVSLEGNGLSLAALFIGLGALVLFFNRAKARRLP